LHASRSRAPRAHERDDVPGLRHLACASSSTRSAGRSRRRAWALRHDLSIYDASYVALAETLDERVLLTADAGLAKVASDAVGAARVQLVVI